MKLLTIESSGLLLFSEATLLLYFCTLQFTAGQQCCYRT